MTACFCRAVFCFETSACVVAISDVPRTLFQCSYLELFDLPLLIVLEVFHVPLKFLALCLSGAVLLLRVLYRCMVVLNGLLGFVHVFFDLFPRSVSQPSAIKIGTHPCGIAATDLLLQKLHLVLLDIEITGHSLEPLPYAARARILLLLRNQATTRSFHLSLRIEQLLHLDKNGIGSRRGAATQGSRGIVDVTVKRDGLHADTEVFVKGDAFGRICVVTDECAPENVLHRCLHFIWVLNEVDGQTGPAIRLGFHLLDFL